MGYFMTTLVTSSLVIASSIPLQATEKELTWTPEAIIQTKTVSDIQISPDNKSVLFVVAEPKMTDEKGNLLSRIYKRNCIDEGIHFPFSAPNVSSMQPRWSPDGQWIAFLSTREDVKNLYLLSSEGGEAMPLTSGKKDVQTFCWSPDGKKIAFVMNDESETKKTTRKQV